MDLLGIVCGCLVLCSYSNASFADIGDEGSTAHEATLEPKLFGLCGSMLDFGTDAGVALDHSKKCLVCCNQYDVTEGGPDGAVKARVLPPSLITRLTSCLAPCGSVLLLRIQDADAEEDSWHIRTEEGCALPCVPWLKCINPCQGEYEYTFNITPGDSTEKQGSITIRAASCFGCCMLASQSTIEIDYPSEGKTCSNACKHAILCAAAMLDAAVMGGRSWCV